MDGGSILLVCIFVFALDGNDESWLLAVCLGIRFAPRYGPE